MRSQEEILNRIKSVEDNDMFGWQRGDLIDYLDYDNARQYLNEDVSKEQWDEAKEQMSPSEKIADYMPFAWEKANDERGISAGRSIEHMISWLWLDGKDEFLDKNDIRNYDNYGKGELEKICKLYNIDHSEWSD